MTGLSNAEIKRTLDEYEIQVSDEVCNSIRVYISLLRRWNQRVSLTTVTSPTETLRFHFGESIFAARVAPILRGRLADVGSGAGFPGLPLRLVRPEMDLTLIESNLKKAAFLSEVVRELQLDRVQVFRGRMNELSENDSGFDFITARAIGKYRDLLRWAGGRLAATGKIVLWLGDEGIDSVSGAADWKWQQPRKIPLSKNRFILVGSRV
jgi:16S rRNA (guanine527-N7)-methyltransferase